ncbi:MAG: FAD-dependent oxidoreductase, partial [Opitutales bacterium]
MDSPLSSRRRFLSSSILGLGAVGALTKASAASAATGRVTEAARELPVDDWADVIVCGAGPAGVTAAISAARAGAKVRLLETHGALGGVWTSSLLGYLLDFDKPGFNQELVRRLRERDAIRGRGVNDISYHPEEMKLLLEELCMASGIKTHLHTRVASVLKDGRKVVGVITESKSGRQAWRGRTIVDTTGDGDVGALAGNGFELGVDNTCPCQPMSMCALLACDDVEALNAYVRFGEGYENPDRYGHKKRLLAELRRAGADPSYQAPTFFPVRGNLILAMLNHEYGVNATDAEAVTAATFRARAEVNHQVRSLRALGGPWKGLQIVATAEQIGVRDGRRLAGRYKVVKDDVAGGARHDDAVVRATFSVDV